MPSIFCSCASFSKSEVTPRLCPAAKRFHWAEKNTVEQELDSFGQLPVSFQESGTGMRSRV